MRIGMLGDLHLRESIPRGRTDNYSNTLFDKFEFILKTCKKNNIEILIQPGDFFESSTEQNTTIISLLYALSACSPSIKRSVYLSYTVSMISDSTPETQGPFLFTY